VNPTRLDNALDAITALVGHEVPFAPGFTTAAGQELPVDAHDQAVAVARDADVVLAFLGLGENHESEGYDRANAGLPDEQLALLEDILAVNPNVVVVLSNGSSVLLPFADRVPAIVEGWLLGQAGGGALADALYGVVNPSGKLTETIPYRLADVPSYLHFPGDDAGVRYGEGLFVGYRGYDATGTEVAFPFGHGLSYTTFDYSDLALTSTDTGVQASLTVTNAGDRTGREIVQVYASIAGSKVVRVPRELKGFASVTLEPGASARVELSIPSTELAYWSVLDHAWVVEGGEYTIEAGSSSRDLRLSGTVAVAGDEPVRPLTLSSTVAEGMAVPAFAEIVRGLAGEIFGSDPDLMRMMESMPLAALAGFSGQPVEQLQALLDQVNAARP
jgi:beta-glucosidase